MGKSSKKQSSKAGLPPGTLVHVGKKRSTQVKINVIDYNAEVYEVSESVPVQELSSFQNADTITWIDINGLHDLEIIKSIGEQFELHGLLLEDVVNTTHRPKVEEYDDHIYLTLKMLGIGASRKSIISEQVSFILGDNWLISFQEREGDVLESVRSRLSENKGIIRKQGADYLLYSLIDTIVDNYFFVSEYFSDSIEKLEEKVLIETNTLILQEIQQQKKLLLNFRKSITPLREAISSIQKEESVLVKSSTTRYLRDVYEHLLQLTEIIESHRDLIASVMDLYLSGESNKMNKTMQVLTIIATIFIPLTFVAGIYGMNFDEMPELHWKYGYQAVWGLMGVIFILMLIFFRRKKWL